MHSEKIIELKFIGKKPTADIEVNNNSHVFFGNGIATSNSHAVSYAANGVLAAVIKTHFPHEFFTASLFHARNKPKPLDEIKGLVSDTRSFNIDVRPPLLYHLNKNFQLYDKTIYFGLTNIKGVGNSVYKKLHSILKSKGSLLDKQFYDQFNWIELLIYILPNLTSTAVKAMIDVGCFSYIKLDKKKMKYEYEKYSLLSNKPKTWIENNYLDKKWATFIQCLDDLLKLPIGRDYACASKKGYAATKDIFSSLKNPPYSLKDSAVYIAECENELLGLPVTCTSLDDCSIEDANCNCQEFNDGRNLSMFWIPVRIDRMHEILTKNKKKMCFLAGSDITGNLDSIVVFPEQYKEFRSLLFEQNNIMLIGKHGKDKSFIVTKIYQL